MTKKELKIRFKGFYNDSKKLAEKEKRNLENKDLQAYKKIMKNLILNKRKPKNENYP